MINTNTRRFVGQVKPNWCPGCGDDGLLSAMTSTLTKLGYQPEGVVIVYGIG